MCTGSKIRGVSTVLSAYIKYTAYPPWVLTLVSTFTEYCRNISIITSQDEGVLA